MDAPSRTLGLGAKSTPPPAIHGRSLTALVVSPTLARSRLSDRTHAASDSPWVNPISTLPDTPNPS